MTNQTFLEQWNARADKALAECAAQNAKIQRDIDDLQSARRAYQDRYDAIMARNPPVVPIRQTGD